MEEETNGFKFAIILLAAFGSTIYGTYDYFQKSTEDFDDYSLISGIIATLILLSLFLIVYVLIKGISMEIQDESLKNSLDNFASDLYLISFFAALIILILIISSFFFANTIYGFSITPIITTLIMLIILYLGRRYIEERLKRATHFKRIGLLEGVLSMLIIFVACLSLWIPLFDLVTDSPLQGHVAVEMESFYYKNDSLIPVFIQVTGPDSGLNIFLYKEDMGDLIGPKGQIHLEPKHNSSEITFGLNSVLFGNALENGRYGIFIKTSNLTEGYYEFVCETRYFNKASIKSFYLFDK